MHKQARAPKGKTRTRVHVFLTASPPIRGRASLTARMQVPGPLVQVGKSIMELASPDKMPAEAGALAEASIIFRRFSKDTQPRGKCVSGFPVQGSLCLKPSDC
jgi:hypothetical protein